jgi:hypothetical protein
MDGKLPEKAIEASEKEFIYTPDYFDELKKQEVEEESDEAPDA